MSQKLLKLVEAIIDCKDTPVPYPIARTMIGLSQELEDYLEREATGLIERINNLREKARTNNETR